MVAAGGYPATARRLPILLVASDHRLPHEREPGVIGGRFRIPLEPDQTLAPVCGGCVVSMGNVIVPDWRGTSPVGCAAGVHPEQPTVDLGDTWLTGEASSSASLR
jgi:hypothetical protein